MALWETGVSLPGGMHLRAGSPGAIGKAAACPFDSSHLDRVPADMRGRAKAPLSIAFFNIGDREMQFLLIDKSD
jgi:hypothetical protein